MIENLIDGRFQAVHAARILVFNPSTGEKIADCFETLAAEIERAIISARSASILPGPSLRSKASY
jgi:acyl-CoA reductase-like NAD-dependent aldehyde dehydrogenase